MSKIKIKYKKGVLPENFRAAVESADENDLRVLVGVMFMADDTGNAGEVSDFSEKIGMDAAETSASLKFWCGAGFISVSKSSKKDKEPEKESAGSEEKANKAITEKFEPAHRGGAIEKSGELSAYSTQELNELIESNKVSSAFLNEADRIMGKFASPGAKGILAGLVCQLGFEEEAILAILAYSYKIGKKSLRYAETLTFALHDDGITKTEDVYIKLNNLEKTRDVSAKIQKMFGMDKRELTTKEKKFLSTWVEKYGYGVEEIRLAFDITVDTKHEALPAYANAIIEAWYAAGLRDAAQIKEYIEKEKAGKKADSNSESSFDLDEFFTAAMNRKYEDFK